MYASIHDSVRALAKKLGADPNGAAVEDTLNNIAKKLGGDPVKAKGISKAIDAITAVADIDDMHNVGKLNVTPTTSAQTLTPESPLDGWDEVKVSAVTSDIDSNITAGNIKKDVQILGVTGSYEGSGGETFEVTITAQGEVGSYTWSANKTYLETMAAIQNGDVISVTLIFDEYTGNATGYFIMHTETDDIITVVIDAEDTEDPSTKAISVLKWYSNDTLDAAVYIPQ